MHYSRTHIFTMLTNFINHPNGKKYSREWVVSIRVVWLLTLLHKMYIPPLFHIHTYICPYVYNNKDCSIFCCCCCCCPTRSKGFKCYNYNAVCQRIYIYIYSALVSFICMCCCFCRVSEFMYGYIVCTARTHKQSRTLSKYKYVIAQSASDPNGGVWEWRCALCLVRHYTYLYVISDIAVPPHCNYITPKCYY